MIVLPTYQSSLLRPLGDASTSSGLGTHSSARRRDAADERVERSEWQQSEWSNRRRKVLGTIAFTGTIVLTEWLVDYHSID